MANKGGFSFYRLLGITKIKNKISRKTGMPWTRQGRRAKFNIFKWLIK